MISSAVRSIGRNRICDTLVTVRAAAMSSQTKRTVINFSPGPAKVPHEVLIQARDELLNYDDKGISVMEMSHRSPTFMNIVKTAENDLRELMKIPSNYKVLFLHGGAAGQFAGIPMNFCSELKTCKADYIVTGSWSAKGIKEAEKYCSVNRVLPKSDKHVTIPDQSTWSLSSDAAYLYHCDNETIHGIEFFDPPVAKPNVPLVSDMTSNFLTKPVDISKYGCIFASSQKNMGIAGLCIVVIREDLIGKACKECPSIFDFKVMDENSSLYNTPPCYPIYMTGLVLKWIKANGGVEAMSERSDQKSRLIYETVDNSNGYYYNPVDKKCRSRITIPFRVGGQTGNEQLEKKFIAEAGKLGMIELKGHRSVGGIRASMFNAMAVDEVKVLADFMKTFQQENPL